MIKKLIPILGFVVITGVFFWQFLLKGLIPIPSDTIVGLYHPYRDLYANNYPNGVPFKNFLITDPVRQLYPWRNLSINLIKNQEIPVWNPYSFSGTPNLANFQSAVFYPFNIIFFIFPFHSSWSFLILLEPLLAGIFLYFYLRNLKIDEYSSFFGGLVFAFSGFFVTWLEWGTVLHTALWLPLILLSIDKICVSKYRKNLLTWVFLFTFSIIVSFFAGHLQTFFYLFLLTFVYLVIRIYQSKNRLKLALIFLGSFLVSLIITSIQSVPTFKFILLSGREVDQLVWQKEGWFIPFKHLIQFIVPDFFGNPTTLNYWGIWNYGELTGYVGITALILSLFAFFYRRDKKTLFYCLIFIFSLIFASSNLISKLPFILNIPFISTAQPTRLLFLADFSLSILAALGLNYLTNKGKLKQMVIPVLIIGTVFAVIFGFTIYGKNLGFNFDNLLVAKRNIYFPGLIFVICSIILISITLVEKRFKNFLILALILITVIDLFRFSWKFNTFSKKEYLYPETSSMNFIQKNIGDYRIATNDPRILPPNFSIMHEIQSAEGYDPLYLERYAEFISAINRNEPNINPPFGFNRIIRIENFSSNLIGLVGIKYVLSLSDMNEKGFSKVYEDGQTKIYENKNVLPKAFFVNSIETVSSKQEVINLMFAKDFNPKSLAIVEEGVNKDLSVGFAKIIKYAPNEIQIETENQNDGFMILTDSYYPSWHAMINNHEVKIYRADYNFRGILVPPGKQVIIFKNSIL